MEAGFGAEEQSTRRGRRVERQRREQAAAIDVSDEARARLARAEQQVRNWSAGAEGERRVAESLVPTQACGWTALHDLRWPERPLANIDHVAVGPGGVVVVDAKQWSGEVTLRDGVLRQNGYPRERELQGVARAAADVTALLAPQHRSAVHGVLCLAAQDVPPTTTASGVVVLGRHQLGTYLVGLDLRLTPYDVADIGRFLGAELGGPAKPKRSGRTRSAGGRAPRPGRTGDHRRPTAAERRRRRARGQLVRVMVVLGLLAVAARNVDTWLPAVGAWLTGLMFPAVG